MNLAPPLLLAITDHWLVQWGLPLAGMMLITAALLFRYRARKRQAAGRPSAREQFEQLRDESGLRGDLESLMVEIEQLARRMGAQLDAKTVQIEKLLREADERIARLEALQQRSDAGGTATPPAPEPTDPLTRSVLDLAGQGLKAPEIAQKLDEHIGKVELILALQRAK